MALLEEERAGRLPALDNERKDLHVYGGEVMLHLSQGWSPEPFLCDLTFQQIKILCSCMVLCSIHILFSS